MATKLQLITELAKQTSKELSSADKWMAFLNSASWQYKYSFEDQVLIFAQRPDAKACADFDTWNEKLNRRINKGAKGIALLRERGNGFYLDHVFDVSDTNRGNRGLDIKLWEYNERFDDAIIETLENTFGELKVTTTLTDAIICAAHNAVEDNKPDYISQLKYAKYGSFLADLDDVNIDVEFQQTAEASVAYMVMQRLGLHPEEIFDNGEFIHIIDFNTVDSIAVLGNAVSEISEQALREISATITAEVRKEKNNAKIFAENKNPEYNVVEEQQPQIQDERTDENVRDNISQRERDTDTELGSSEERTPDRQIRDDAEEIPEAESKSDLLSDDAQRNIDGTPARDRQDSERTGGTDSAEVSESGGSERETESGESAEVDRSYEQPQTFRRRGSAETVSSQLSLFDLVDDSNIQEDMQREAERLTNIRPAFSISQQIIDEVLTSGPNGENSILNICIEMSKGKSLESQAEFLKQEYKSGGKGFVFDGTQIATWWDNTGLRISRGKDTVIADSVLSWEDVAKRINELLDMGRFAPKDILNAVHETRIKRTAEKFWYMHQDVNFDDYPDLRKIFPEEWFDGGFPKSTARLMKMVEDPKQLDRIIGITRLLESVDKNHDDVMRWKMYKPEKVLPELSDMLLPEKVFTTDIENPIEPERFITDDELHEIITEGFGSRERKFRTQRFFAEHPSIDERIEFLHNELGKNKYSFLQYYLDIKNQSFVLSRNDIMSPFAKVTVKFKDVEKKISELVDAGVYLSKNEREELYPKWLDKTETEERWRKRRADIDTYLRDFWRDKSDASVLNIPKRAQYLFEYCSDSNYESSIIAEKGIIDLIGKGELEFAEAMNSIETRTQLADCCYQLARSTSDVTIRNTGYMLADELRSLEAISLHRVGDFYEIYGEEAKKAAQILELQLTYKEKNGVRTDLVGLPAHALEKYVTRLQEENVFVIFPDVEVSERLNVQEESITEDAEIIALEETTEETSTTQGPLWDEGTAMRIAKEEWDKAHKPPKQQLTLRQRNYEAIYKIAPEILDGTARYIKLEAGEAFMPLFIEKVGDDHIAIYHHYEAGGDLIADPDMSFWINQDEKALHARSFQQDIPPIYQQVAYNGTINMKLETELNSFARQWFRNIHSQGYTREIMKVPYRDDEIEIHYNRDGSVRELSGEVSYIEAYKKEHGIETDKDFEKAVSVINAYVKEEFDSDSADFEDISRVGLAFTHTEDGEHTIDVAANLINFSIEKYVDGQLTEEIKYDSLAELIKNELEGMSFDDLVYIPEEKLAPLYAKEEQSIIDFYRELHSEDDGETVVFFLFGDNYELYGTDAEKAKSLLGVELTAKTIDGYGYAMCSFPKEQLEEKVNTLNDAGFDVIVTDENRKSYKIISTDKALGRTSDGTELVGKELSLNDRKFIVDSVNVENGSVSLKDITFQNSTGFPIFRKENVDFVRTALEQQEEKIVPEFEKVKPQRVANTIVYPEIPMVQRNNFVIDNDELGYGGAKEKFRKNMEAIRVLKECEFEHRLATPEEQKILSEYVGWGGLADAFDETKSNWANEFQELYAALSPDEYEQARASTLTSHYTSPVIIKSMYKALENMGFSQGNILEPSCGIGNFMGLVPESMKDSKIYGIELDSITGRIAQQLYQRNSIAIQGYEDTTLPDSFFDVAIGNVPFGDYKLLDKKYNKHNFLIHDYFFAKTLDKVRPGGIVAFITSSGTMDKRNSKVRQYIAQRADLVGAIRLPNNAFLKNAGTEVTADILFLQRRDRMTDIMPDWVHLGEIENGIAVNQYFVDNPDMILGEMQTVSGPFGPTPTCMPYDTVPLSEQLNEAIQNIHATITEYEIDDISNDEDMSIPADPNVRNFSFTLVDGDVYFRENSLMRKVELNATAQNRIKGMIAIRDCVRDLIEYQTEGYPDWEIQKQQDKLNKLYDDFTKKYGLINSRGNSMAFSDDSSYFLLCSLEVLDENGELERKADMFTKRTIGAKQEITKVDTSSEALAVSLGEKAKIDMQFMSELTGKTEDELYEDLKGVIFMNPEYEEDNTYQPEYLTADEYLSGNVREKLSLVEPIAFHNEAFKINVEALQKVQPKDLTASEITVKLGSTWIPPEDIKDFIFELLSPGWYAKDRIEVRYSNITGTWTIEGKSADKGVKSQNTFGTKRINAYKIIEESLNLKDVRIFDYVEDAEGRKKPVLNKKETTIAQQKQDLIKAEFDNWIWKNPDRRERLTKLYNERFNSVRPREYDGSHITFSGMNPEIVLRKHQEDAVARVMYGGNTLLGHVVGAGKTWTMVAAAMEMKRLGLCNKSLFVVPNHLTEQWASEFLQLYPAANILVATKKDFETKNRKKFCGRIATGDYDAVIIGHSQFEKIPMSIERQKAVLERQKTEIMHGIIELKAEKGERFTIKQLEKSKKAIEARLEKLNDQSRKDDVVTFEELGVDRIFVDEAHYYKNLYLYTKMRNVGGISQTEAQKSSDLFMKTQYLDELTGGKGVIFATGTPVSNSMVELYTMQRYLQYKTLQDKNLQHFDAWASTFGETVTAIELAPEGTGYRAKTRFARFFNLPELMSMFKDVADIQTADMLNLPTPEPHYKTVAVEPTEIQKEMVSELAERAEKVRNRMVDPSEDNMLKITNDGRKLALDQRLINSLLPDDESSKVSACSKEVFDIWEQTSDIKGTQLVFCDLSTPKNDGTFNVYTDIRDKLIAYGVPENEIEFIHNAETEVKKKELFSRVRKGDVRVLLGSTPKMGAGTNVQRLLYASHDLDCPWRPADLEQRAGRIIRQGNTNPDVHIVRYVTKDTFDSYMWQLVENKQKFIGQIMTSKSPVRSAEDIDEMALSYAEIKALTTGNPYIKEKMDLDTQVAKLKVLKSAFMSLKYELEDKVIKHYPREIADLTERIKGFDGDIVIAQKYPKQEDVFYPMTIDGLPYTDKERAGTALLERCKKMTSPEPIPIGDYKGFSMDLSFDAFSKTFYVTLKGNLSHKVELGTDIFGNLQRIDNALEGLPKRLEITKENLEETKKQFELAKVESQKDFPQEAELQEKIKRLAEVDALLNMDKKDREGAELGEPDDGEMPQKKVVGLER